MRSKPFLTYFLICAVPLLLLAALNYWNGIRSVDTTVNTILQDDLRSFTTAVDRLLEQQENTLLQLAVDPNVQRACGDPTFQDRLDLIVPPVFKYSLFKGLTISNSNRQPLWFDTTMADSELWARTPQGALQMRQAHPIPDPRVWTTQGNVLLERLVEDGSFNSGINFSVPIHDANGLGNSGAIVGAVDLEKLFANAARSFEARATAGRSTAPSVFVRNSSNNTIYQTGTAQQRPSLSTASAPMPRLNVTVAVARDKSAFLSAARVRGLVGFGLAILLAAAAAFFLNRDVRKRSRGIARVEADLSAIAHGDIDRRIVVQSSDDARAMADNINAMTAQLRAQIAREEESRQFETFIRLSAMLTHDLKNAIEGLSLTVNNMERHFDNEQFRIDAMKGLTNATDKLKAIVDRLSRPVSTLSGEHKRPAETDVVPILKRVVAMTAEPVRGKHTIQTKLPATLYAFVDPLRVEEVVENLILNALEAMGDTSGTLTVAAGPDAKGAPSFSVSDTGPGMSPVFIETRLFRPFSTTKKNGIGLGLYTCREVMRASGGAIEVQSTEGAGTTFRVVLPSVPLRQA